MTRSTGAGARKPGPLVVIQSPKEPRPKRAEAPDLLIVHHLSSTRLPIDTLQAAAEKACGERGLRHRLYAIPETRDAARAVRQSVARAIREGCTCIVAAGGDGTVSMVAQCLARRRGSDSPVSLGIIPAGTANVLARDLGIPLDLEGALEIITRAEHTLDLDAIRVGRRYIFTQVGVGPDALMIRDTPREKQAALGRLAYMLTFVRRALVFRPRWFTLKIDGQVIRERAWQLVVANVGSLGSPPFTWGPRIDPTDGTADVCVFNVRRKRDYGKLVWRLLSNRHRRDEQTHFYRFRDSVTIDANVPVLVQGDGEILGRTPITVHVVPAALRVLVTRTVEPSSTDAPAPEAVAVTSGEPAASPSPASRAPEKGSNGTEEAPAKAIARAAEPGEPATGETPTVTEDVHQMIGQRSKTWVLQGPLKHPLAALEAYDAAIFLRLNTASFGPVLDRFLELVSRFIHYGEGWAVVVLAMLFVDFPKGLHTAVEVLPALWATMLTVNLLLKRLFRRRRPFIAFVKARVIGPRPRDFSFPSGHAAAGFAGAVLLGMHVPAWSPVFYAFAVTVSFSRIYLGVHYPSDVAMGAFSGSVLALAFHALIRLLLATP